MSKDNNKRTSAYKVIDTLFCPTCRKPRDEVMEAVEDGFAVLKWQGVIEYRFRTDKVIQFQGALLPLGVQKGFPIDSEPITQGLSLPLEADFLYGGLILTGWKTNKCHRS